MNTTEFADQYLFTQLGITDFFWPGDPNGHAMGGSDLYIIPRFMAKIGYLMLRGGQWEGHTLVPLSYVIDSSMNHHSFIPNNPNADGYGYQWWTYPRLGAYCARGWLGQYIWVIPSHDLVVVITGNNNAIEDHWLVERHIIPATTPVPPSNPLIIILPMGVGISIVVVLSVIYWKRRVRQSKQISDAQMKRH
jgi:CubicO group peptidase (beta-lactamase class C family)